jgi:fumarate reductase subunit C
MTDGAGTAAGTAGGTAAVAAPERGQAHTPGAGGLRTFRPRLPATWWLQNRRYALFGLRELTAIPVVLWLLSLLVEVSRLGSGPPQTASGFYPYASPAYVLFSVVCFVFALLHSITWLNLSGVILRVRLGQKDVAPQVVTAANYAQWLVVSLVVGGALIFLGAR